MKKISLDGESSSSISFAPCFCHFISILGNIFDEEEYLSKKGKIEKEKGKGREEEGRRCKNRWQNRQKFWDVGNFLQLQRLGYDFLELIGIHHLKKA